MKQPIKRYRRLARIALTAFVVLAFGACEEDCCWVDLRVYAGPDADVDSTGIAGLEVEINGRTLRNEDITATRGGTWIPIDTRQKTTPRMIGEWRQRVRVGRSGNQYVFVRIVENSRIVADGWISWRLAPYVSWILEVTRGLPDLRPRPFGGSCGVGRSTIPVTDAAGNERDDVVHLCLSGWYR